MKILVINPGATSTKIAVFEDENEVMRVGIDHDAAKIAEYPHIVDQMPFRRDIILETITEKGYKLEAVRGGARTCAANKGKHGQRGHCTLFRFTGRTLP